MKKPYWKIPMEVNKKYQAASFALTFLFLLSNLQSYSQESADSSRLYNKKVNTFFFATGAGYGAGLVALNYLWYKNTNRQSFYFFNDNAEWKQVDKLGHFYTAFYLSHTLTQILGGLKVGKYKANTTGAWVGFLMTIPVEIMDGFSDGYGASVGDVVANAFGSSFFLGQYLTWKELRIFPKFSFQRTPYSALRPGLLGENFISEVVKDYNGQTYWLSIDVDKFTAFPKWLNVAVGYGADQMLYARDIQNQAMGYQPFRQYYLAIDFDLTAIKTRSKFIKTLLFLTNMVKLPAPTIEFSKKRSRFYPFYF